MCSVSPLDDMDASAIGGVGGGGGGSGGGSGGGRSEIPLPACFPPSSLPLDLNLSRSEIHSDSS